MKNFRDLKVWQEGHQLVLSVYRATARFPKDELFGLTSQLRRAAVSVPANIAEGCGRGGDPEFGRFLQIAFGSACEAEYHCLLATDLGYLTSERADELSTLIVSVKRMLSALLKRVRADR